MNLVPTEFEVSHKPVEIALNQFRGLREINLDGMYLTGSIPSSIALFGNLHTLNLANNKITGDLTTGLLRAPKLHKVKLSNNRITSIRSIIEYLAAMLSTAIVDNTIASNPKVSYFLDLSGNPIDLTAYDKEVLDKAYRYRNIRIAVDGL